MKNQPKTRAALLMAVSVALFSGTANAAADQSEAGGFKPPCFDVAVAVFKIKARDVAKDYLPGLKAETYPAPGIDENTPYVMTLENNGQNARARRKQIKDGYLVAGDMMVPVFAHIDDETKEKEGIIMDGNIAQAGILIARCSAKNPKALETIWWQQDVVAR